MATNAGSASPSVGDTLSSRASHFTFLQAMWLLQRSLRETVPVGQQGPPEHEAVRLSPSFSLAFPPGDIESVETPADGRFPYRMTITFLGLYGAHSPLPNYYAEMILHRSDEEDPIRAFLDVFNHRLLSLLYRGMLKYRSHLLFRPQGADEFSWRLFAFLGLGSDGFPEGTGLPPARLLRFVGLLTKKPRSAAAVESALSCYFSEVPLRIQQCVARWSYLRREQRCLLGRQAFQLGTDATIGERTMDRMGKFRISVGPVSYEAFRRFLPGGERLQSLWRLARFACPDWLDFDAQIILRGSDTPRLGVTLSADSQLGWTTGLFSQPAPDLPVRFCPA